MGSNQQLDSVKQLNIIQDKWESRYDKLQDKYDEMEKYYKDKLDQKEQKYNELLDICFNLKKQIKQNQTNQQQDSSSNSSLSSSSSIAISSINDGQACDILSALSFKGSFETKIETFLPDNHDNIVFKDSPLNWEGFENTKNTKLCIEKIVEQLKTIGIDLENKAKDFKIVDVSRKLSFLKCNFLDTFDTFSTINGTCDAVIVPRAIGEDFCKTQLRVMFEFKTTKYFSSSGPGQIIGEIIGGSYHSFHPFILIKTDLAKNYEIWQIRGKEIFKCETTAEMAFKSIAHWMNNICSKKQNFDPRVDPYDESLTSAYFFFEEKFKVRIRDEICCLLKEQLEVAEMADSDLSPFEKCLSTQQIGTSGLVYPAALFGHQVSSRQVPIAEFNIEEEPGCSAATFRGQSGEISPNLLKLD